MALSTRDRRWNDLATTVPSLPGGADSQFTALVGLLTQLRDGVDVELVANASEADKLQRQLGTLKFTKREGQSLTLTDEGRAWLAVGSPESLAAIFHDRYAFFGEIVDFLQREPADVEAIRAHASDVFKVGWRSLDQVRRRLAWLRVLGLVEEGAHRRYRTTDAGATWLAGIEVLGAVPDLVDKAVFVPAPPLLGDRLASLDHETRVLSWDYLPKGPVEAMSFLLGQIQEPRRKSDVIVSVSQELEIAASSAKSFIDGTSRLELFEYVGKSEIRATPLGLEWLASASSLNLVRLLHRRFLGLGEALTVTDDEPRTVGELHRALYVGIESPPNQSRTASMFKLLTDAGAVAHVGPIRYVITEVGRNLAIELPLAKIDTAAVVDYELPAAEARVETVEGVVEELITASRFASNPARFEAACAAAFEALDVSAKHLGGPGRTDVLVTINSNLRVIGTAIVDAKAASGQLNEKSVNFEALKEHARKAHATLMAVVAPTYEGAGRIREWATSNGVVLFTADELGELVRSHQVSPFSAADIRDLLTVEGHAAALSRQQANVNHLGLVASVVDELTQEEDEPVSARDIARLLRRNGQSTTDADVSSVLEFLALPQVAAIDGDPRGGYTMPSSLAVAAKRLRAIATVLDEASV
ncbi:hypothetical protein [Microbacterium gorillae]|uniref:hypothetical protein n=1 Tax=Microbacterium gorillae TaxID=1231063 RepID=UPI003D9927DC